MTYGGIITFFLFISALVAIGYMIKGLVWIVTHHPYMWVAFALYVTALYLLVPLEHILTGVLGLAYLLVIINWEKIWEAEKQDNVATDYADYQKVDCLQVEYKVIQEKPIG